MAIFCKVRFALGEGGTLTEKDINLLQCRALMSFLLLAIQHNKNVHCVNNSIYIEKNTLSSLDTFVVELNDYVYIYIK